MKGIVDYINQIDRKASRRIEVPDLSIVTFNPVWTAVTVNPVLNNGSLAGKYYLRGPMCLLKFVLSIGTTTTLGTGDWIFSLPFPHSAAPGSFGFAHVRDVGTANYFRIAQLTSSGTDLRLFLRPDDATNFNTLNAAYPIAWASGDSLTVQIEYPIR